MSGRLSNGDGGASFDELTRQPHGWVRCLKCGVEEWFETPGRCPRGELGRRSLLHPPTTPHELLIRPLGEGVRLLTQGRVEHRMLICAVIGRWPHFRYLSRVVGHRADAGVMMSST